MEASFDPGKWRGLVEGGWIFVRGPSYSEQEEDPWVLELWELFLREVLGTVDGGRETDCGFVVWGLGWYCEEISAPVENIPLIFVLSTSVVPHGVVTSHTEAGEISLAMRLSVLVPHLIDTSKETFPNKVVVTDCCPS